MNLYLLSALASALFFSLAGITYKLNLKYTFKDPVRFLFFVFLTQLPLALLLLPFTKVYFPLSLLLPFFSYNLSYLLGALLVGLAIKNLDASVFMPLFNIQIIFTTLFAFIILGEAFKTITYFLMLIIVLAGFLVSYEEESKFSNFFSRPILKFVSGLVFYAMSDVFSGQIVRDFGVLNLRFWSSLILPVLALSFIPFFQGKEGVTKRKLLAVSANGLFGFLGLLTILFGFVYSVSLAQVLSRFSAVITLVLVIILAKFRGDLLEKRSRKVYLIRLIGALSMTLSAGALIFSK